ncbi:hypothetical protein J3Q64DRAFT_1703132 [Phycomyces blakesleeanus]|uniref:F-box domain-containing protein n=2 Tax=Phycomyces blakesleeanus TaxID=4837 RepID=A0A167K9N3_PHYB8|nr:hypothetical protein PHYBLDRAFT_174239 [Phycomyces blakesleeanus NRRL 1555(-)]OAD67549.1 hypothetical protein PHYBLDRAFT_174239 [Phycomyces blakesleeanus NRRL 1555(-)]|eukprot:XP_018285589.1 hypothetical protein PHYBLDRAFT_174239 [Phycomyces blakesleeanus NRRL 1555(-)]
MEYTNISNACILLMSRKQNLHFELSRLEYGGFNEYPRHLGEELFDFPLGGVVVGYPKLTKMLEYLAPEIIAHIADYLPEQSAGELAQTCQSCYNAVLPRIWQQLSIVEPEHLSRIAHRLQSNRSWNQNAIRFVRSVNFSKKNNLLHSIYPSHLAAILGYTISGLDDDTRAAHRPESLIPRKNQPMDDFARNLLILFPNISNLDLECDLMLSSFCCGTGATKDQGQPRHDSPYGFNGALRLRDYTTGNTALLRAMLDYFPNIQELTLEGSRIVSICDDIDASILSKQDIIALTSFDSRMLGRLSLSYLSHTIPLSYYQSLFLCLPELYDLSLEWFYPPTKEYYIALSRLIQNTFSLTPGSVNTSKNSYKVRFTYRSNK